MTKNFNQINRLTLYIIHLKFEMIRKFATMPIIYKNF